MEAKKRLRLRWRRRPRLRKINFRKGLFLLPHTFTIGNAFLGFYSLVSAAQGKFVQAAYCILWGALMDMIDGRMARWFSTTSAFGVQIDSLSDAISFCIAPAFLIYFWQLKDYGLLGLAICFFYCAAGMIRLARFNIIHEQQTRYFLGVPSTIAGCFMAIVVLYGTDMSLQSWQGMRYGLAGLLILLALLMVSSLHFPAFKQQITRGTWAWYRFVVVMACICLLSFILPVRHLLLGLFFCYFCYAISYMITSMIVKRRSSSKE